MIYALTQLQEENGTKYYKYIACNTQGYIYIYIHKTIVSSNFVDSYVTYGYV